MVAYKLKIDYDRRSIIKFFKFKLGRIYMVYYVKREHFPEMQVTRADRTRHGWHLHVRYDDISNDCFEIGPVTERERRLMLLHFQNAFGSDGTRNLFDVLRTLRGDEDWNLMFDYKNGKRVVRDSVMRKKLNAIIAKTKAQYEKKVEVARKDWFTQG